MNRSLQGQNEKIEVFFLDPLKEIERIEAIWLELQETSPHSYFTSWGWIGTWLASLSPDVLAKFVYGIRDSKNVFCCVLVERQSTLHRFFYKNRAHINATGDTNLDELTIEYNGVLVNESGGSIRGLLAHNGFSEIEEFLLPGRDAATDKNVLFDENFFIRRINSDRSYFVDLDDVRAGGQPYIDRLSSKRRKQMRRSIRKLSELGEIRTQEAKNVDEAIEMLEALVKYHQEEWEFRGKSGAFSSKYFYAFHRDLITKRFYTGEIQLLSIVAGDIPLGYLYNFVYQRELIFYQSGFNYGIARNTSPGIITLIYSIQHNLDKGLGKYNFLAGDAQYKKSLATGYDTLEWLVASRKNFKSRLETLLRGLKRGTSSDR